MNQTSLDIPQIDEEKTRAKMERMLEKYKMLRLQTPEEFFQRSQQHTPLRCRVFQISSTHPQKKQR